MTGPPWSASCEYLVSASPTAVASRSRLLAVGNASGDWGHQLDSSQLWLRSVTVSGFNSAAYLSAHPEAIRPALEAALQATAAGLGEMDVDVLPFSAAATAHERMGSRSRGGRIVLTPDPVVP